MFFSVKRYCFYWVCAFGTLLLIGCTNSQKDGYAEGCNDKENQLIQKQKQLETSLANANKILSAKEKENIISYFSRLDRQYTFYKGVYISVINTGTKQSITEHNNVKIEYSYTYLDNDNNHFSEPKTITISAKTDTQLPFGLIQSLTFMTKDMQALVAIPSSINYTIDQDGQRIEDRQIAIYKIKVINIY